MVVLEARQKTHYVLLRSRLMIDYIVALGIHTYSVHAYILARICILCTGLSVCNVSIGSVIYGRRALTNSNGQTQGPAEEMHRSVREMSIGRM